MKFGEWYLIHDYNPKYDNQVGYLWGQLVGEDKVVEIEIPNVGSRRCHISRIEKLDPAVGDLLNKLYR